MLSNERECKCKTAKGPGAKRPGYERARERIGQGARRPGSERARERKFQGAKVLGSELASILLADSLRGANWPGSEKARFLQSAPKQTHVRVTTDCIN